MPTCKKCNETFSSQVVIDGKRHVLSSRKYCLECSPFKKHNTVKLHITSVAERLIKCSRCGREYLYSRKHRHGHNTKLCNSCVVNVRRFALKRKCVQYKGGKCEQCGYSKCIGALTFHHIDPSQKEFTIAGNHSRAWNVIKEELDKCALLCANCHHEVHFVGDSI